jgi:hypothetical protein
MLMLKLGNASLESLNSWAGERVEGYIRSICFLSQPCIRDPVTLATMESSLHTILTTSASLVFPLVLNYYTGIFKWIDLAIRVILAEINRANNKERLESRISTSEESEDIKDTVISIVGYREAAESYERALRSLKSSGAPILIAGIDGDSDEDLKMVDVFNTVI